MTPNAPQVLVVGGGVIGLACAHHLNRAGQSVTVIDRGQAGGACSSGNCGHILPSHVLPLNSWATVRKGLASLFNPRAPFRIKPRFDPGLARWFWSFLTYCRQASVWRAARALKPLLDNSAAQYRALAAGLAADLNWSDGGVLYLFETRAGLARFAEEDMQLTRHVNVSAEAVSPPILTRMEPRLREGLAGGYLYRQDGCLSPERLIRVWRDRLESDGVVFIEHCPFDELTIQSGAISRLRCRDRVFEPDAVVFAMGALSGALTRHLALNVPVAPGKGYSITLKDEGCEVRHPWVLPEHGVAISPFADSLRIGSMMEFAGYDASLPDHRFRQLRQSANRMLARPLSRRDGARWMGWRPMTPDSLPLIGPVPGLANAILATGHQMIGVMTAPATGQLVTDYITGRAPVFPADAFLPERFQ